MDLAVRIEQRILVRTLSSGMQRMISPLRQMTQKSREEAK